MDYEKIEQSEIRRRILGKGVTYLFLTIWALIVLFPFLLDASDFCKKLRRL